MMATWFDCKICKKKKLGHHTRKYCDDCQDEGYKRNYRKKTFRQAANTPIRLAWNGISEYKKQAKKTKERNMQ